MSHERVITAEQRAFWAFRPLAKPAPPSGAARRLAAHRHRSLYPRASRTGRPVAGRCRPTSSRCCAAPRSISPACRHAPDDVDAFLKDESPDAFDKGDRSPARVTAVRRSVGPHLAGCGAIRRRRLPQPRSDGPRLQSLPNAHLYRDWVIRAFNDDLPYDQFVTAQLAADLLDETGAPAAPAGTRLPRPRPVVLRQRRGRNHARRRASRSRRCRDARHARPHGRLRAVPRSQVRSDSHQGLLLARRRVPQHRVPRIPARAEGHRRGPQGAAKRRSIRSGRCCASTPTPKAQQLAGTLAFQAAKYMQAAWQVTGEPKKEKSRDHREGEARLRALRSVAGVSRSASRPTTRT